MTSMELAYLILSCVVFGSIAGALLFISRTAPRWTEKQPDAALTRRDRASAQLVRPFHPHGTTAERGSAQGRMSR